MFKRPSSRHRHTDEVNESIIDALNKMPPPYGGDVIIDQNTMPFAKLNPPSRETRRELHVTPPNGRPYLSPPRAPRPSRGHVLLASRATLPLFHATTHVVGWRAFILPKKPSGTFTGAMRAIDAYTDKTIRVICQQTGQAKGELWERARDYDKREAELRAQHPLMKQKQM